MDGLTTGTTPSSRSRDTKTRINIKNPVGSNIDDLPALIVNGRGNRLKMQFSELQKPRDLDLDLGSGHAAYRRASVIDLYLQTKCH